MKFPFSPSSSSGRRQTTEEFAAEICCRADSIRKRYSQTGSYHGVRPEKLPNRRLLWPADAVEQLIKNGGAK
ncbi:DNA-binding protein [Burkholderia pseudomultivorans]|uniref:DNA-binding protein n=1 Tax=Burkholderia pseudomultivorans TaxID=1207504 RepID=UPI0009BD346E|nr:DNA-binding protein [Burkholderia pseudomultivorans]